MWAGAWTPEQILSGRETEEKRHQAYFEQRARLHGGALQRLWRWVKGFFDMGH